MIYWGLVITLSAVIVLGGGTFYIIWLMTRPPKMTWTARVYQLGSGVKPLLKNEKGEILYEEKICYLFAQDIRKRTEHVHDQSVY